jgi:hypothetical protein
MTKYLHAMIRVSSLEDSIAFLPFPTCNDRRYAMPAVGTVGLLDDKVDAGRSARKQSDHFQIAP